MHVRCLITNYTLPYAKTSPDILSDLSECTSVHRPQHFEHRTQGILDHMLRNLSAKNIWNCDKALTRNSHSLALSSRTGNKGWNICAAEVWIRQSYTSRRALFLQVLFRGSFGCGTACYVDLNRDRGRWCCLNDLLQIREHPLDGLYTSVSSTFVINKQNNLPSSRTDHSTSTDLQVQSSGPNFRARS